MSGSGRRSALAGVTMGVTLMLVVAGTTWALLHHRAASPRADGRLTVKGVAPGMTVAQVVQLLGKPGSTLGSEDVFYQMTYEKQNFHDPLVICQKGRVVFVEGQSLESDGRQVLQAGISLEHGEAILGTPDEVPAEGQAQGFKYSEIAYAKRHLHLTAVQTGGADRPIVQYVSLGENGAM